MRARFLGDDPARALLRRVIDACRAVAPFEVDAFVPLPDHLHAIRTTTRSSTGWPNGARLAVVESFTGSCGRACTMPAGVAGAAATRRRLPDFDGLDTEGVELASGE